MSPLPPSTFYYSWCLEYPLGWFGSPVSPPNLPGTLSPSPGSVKEMNSTPAETSTSLFLFSDTQEDFWLKSSLGLDWIYWCQYQYIVKGWVLWELNVHLKQENITGKKRFLSLSCEKMICTVFRGCEKGNWNTSQGHIGARRLCRLSHRVIDADRVWSRVSAELSYIISVCVLYREYSAISSALTFCWSEWQSWTAHVP